MRQRRYRAAVLASAVLLLAACGGTQTSAPPARAPLADKVQVLRLPGGDYGYPSPFTYFLGPGLVNVMFEFDTLLWKDSTGNPIPWLATTWSHSADGKQWRFNLHNNVTFQDGVPLTAADVVFSYQYFTTGPGKVNPGVFGPLPPMTVTAESTNVVVFNLSQPLAPFEITVAGRVPILPQHIWGTVTDPLHFTGPSSLIGSGPYVFKSYDQAAGAYDFVANQHYFMGVPYVREIQFVPAPDPLLALQRGDVDIAGVPYDQGVPADQLAKFKVAKFAELSGPGEGTTALHFNMTHGFPFNDVRFRQAIAYALDRQDMVKRILYGQGEVGSFGDLAASNSYAATGLPTYAHDATKANALLDQIGLKRNASGVRTLPDGRPFTPELMTTPRWNPMTVSLVKEYLSQVGIQLKIDTLDYNAFNSATAQAQYDMAIIAYGGLGGDPDYLRTRFSSKVKSQVFSKSFGYSNPQFDALADQQLVAVDPAQRKSIVVQMQNILAQDVPTINLYLANRVQIYVKSVFAAWYYTPAGVFGGYPGVYNKHVFVTGKKVGF